MHPGLMEPLFLPTKELFTFKSRIPFSFMIIKLLLSLFKNLITIIILLTGHLSLYCSNLSFFSKISNFSSDGFLVKATRWPTSYQDLED
uniref:Uncharacterized protein n=1 Tax=Leersia perrieri TaxID=77586 RepID=A0A0D9XU76_9ORYZ